MRLVNLSLPSPAEQLAADEALLDWCEDGHPEQDGGLLMFWEPSEAFVVLGYANKVSTEVNTEMCAARGVPIYRRCSGGGTVVQLPGGLNYSLILRIEENGPTRNITAANKFIMEMNAAAIQSVLGERAQVSVRGHTDLALGEPGKLLKFAGNSQRRRKHFLLFHGTLLLNCDLNLIGELLRTPSLEPDYRAGRSHADFVANLKLPAALVKTALTKVWQTDGELTAPPGAEVQKLAREKYSTQEWNFKF